MNSFLFERVDVAPRRTQNKLPVRVARAALKPGPMPKGAEAMRQDLSWEFFPPMCGVSFDVSSHISHMLFCHTL